jgi:hypothetical protein
MVGVALAEAGQEPQDRCLGDLAEVGDALLVQVGQVAAQVAAVGRQRVRRQPALDREVVEVGADGARRLAGYASTSSGETAAMPTASPTALLVSVPSWVLSPSSRLRSALSACCQPLLARATA